MTYTAINIGPIVQTLELARKPRELWAASFLFSHLMKYLIKALPKDVVIISPTLIDENVKYDIGLYPDRVFVTGVVKYDSLKPAIESFAKNLNLSADYFNIMIVTGDYTKESEAIKDLNQKLDCIELFKKATNYNSEQSIKDLIRKKDNSKLFVEAMGSKQFPIDSLGEIAAIQLKNNSSWEKFVEDLRSDDKKKSGMAYKNFSKEDLKSYHKYICVVQADGDNVGKTISNQGLQDGKVKEISDALLQFGKKAKQTIKDFGGLPIYAGGDDLLFIAPVVGKNGNCILSLLETLNDISFGGVKNIINPLKLKDENNNDINASLSFGVSISYHKYPLYEALESARKLLFLKAKKVNGKNAVALELRKHSGGSFYLEYSKNNAELKDKFNALISASVEAESVVSAVSHKIRSNEGLLSIWINEPNANERNENFFKKYMEYDTNKPDKYKKAALEMMNVLCNIEDKAENLVKNMYGLLRIAKFINGEEVIDE